MDFRVTVSKGTVTYDIDNVESESEALDIADEWYNERDFEIMEVEEITEENLSLKDFIDDLENSDLPIEGIKVLVDKINETYEKLYAERFGYEE